MILWSPEDRDRPRFVRARRRPPPHIGVSRPRGEGSCDLGGLECWPEILRFGQQVVREVDRLQTQPIPSVTDGCEVGDEALRAHQPFTHERATSKQVRGCRIDPCDGIIGSKCLDGCAVGGNSGHVCGKRGRGDRTGAGGAETFAYRRRRRVGMKLDDRQGVLLEIAGDVVGGVDTHLVGRRKFPGPACPRQHCHIEPGGYRDGDGVLGYVSQGPGSGGPERSEVRGGDGAAKLDEQVLAIARFSGGAGALLRIPGHRGVDIRRRSRTFARAAARVQAFARAWRAPGFRGRQGATAAERGTSSARRVCN